MNPGYFFFPVIHPRYYKKIGDFILSINNFNKTLNFHNFLNPIKNYMRPKCFVRTFQSIQIIVPIK